MLCRVLLGWVVLCGFSSLSYAEVTVATLLEEMTDLAQLAEYPDPAYKTGQFSSYDRASTGPDNEETWFANYDRGMYLREEENNGRKEYVLVDADGPGAVVRIWSANPQGTLHFYVDHAKEPTWSVPFTDLTGGELETLPKPLSGTRAAGWNLYFPIPYAKHLKVTSDKSEQGGFYYLINHRTYEPGTKVRSFDPGVLKTQRKLIAETAEILEERARPMPDIATRSQHARERIELAPGEKVTVADFDGAWAISALMAELQADDRDRALRQTVLEIKFDGKTTVSVPVGDFFGSAPGVNPYTSLPMHVKSSGEMVSYWLMPCEKSVRISLRNLGDQKVIATLTASLIGYEWTDRSMHFYARWKSAFDVDTKPTFDWNYATIDGQGVFVGSAFHITNPVRQWWGEGDEKIYIDGEKFPSFFGTGTEDYFGYAWCSPELFQHAYHNQTRCDGPANYGHTSVNRWHIIDAIPFEKSLKFDMELWHWIDTVVDMSVTTYWYARPGATSTHKPLTAADLKLQTVPEYQAPRVAGALEGEEMTVLEKTGNPASQHVSGTSNEHHLWWHGGVKPGDVLKLAFEAPEAGTYEVYGRFVTAHDYGIVTLAINGTPAGAERDFYHEPGSVVVTDEILLGEFELKKGRNTLTVTSIGRHPDAKPEHMFGLDYLRLEAAQP
jgi:hypothetical protein